MLDQILNPPMDQAAAILALLAVGIYAAAKVWWAHSAERRDLMAAEASAARKSTSARELREQLRQGY